MANVTIHPTRTMGDTGIVRSIHDANNNHIGITDGEEETIPLAMVYAFPNAPQVYCSPIAGDPDPVESSVISMFWHEVTGFLQPKAGILTEIHAVFQGNEANPVTAKNVRWTVATVKQDPTAVTGLAIGQILDTGVTSVAGNVVGDVTLATGKSLVVPTQFVVCIKAATDGTNLLLVQNMKSGGPVPGVIGAGGGSTLVAAATYSTTSMDVNAVTPPAISPGEKLQVSQWKGLAVYIKWKGQ